MQAQTIVLLILGVLAIIASYFVVQYLEKRKLTKLVRRQFGNPPVIPNSYKTGRRYWESMLEQDKPERYVDDITWNDLDMNNVYVALNTCFSAVGDVALYTALRRIPENPGEALAPLERLMTAMEQNPPLREQLQYVLGSLGRYGAGSMERAPYHAEELQEKRPWLYTVLGILPLLGIPLLFFSLPAGVLFLVVGGVINFALNAQVRGKREGNILAVAYLVSQITTAKKIAARLEKTEPQTAKELMAAAKPLGFVGLSYSILYIDNVLCASGFPSPLGFFQLPMIAYCGIVKKLTGMGPQIRNLYEALGRVDMAAALLSYRHSLPLWCRPQFRQQSGIEAKALYHPLLAEPVANDAALPGDALFTGSNASGKSTFIKAVAVNNILAQTLATCTAASYALQPGLVATSMAVADSIVEGDSYFIAEIKSLRRLVLLAQSGQNATLFIDEILKGTNTVERVAAAASVLAYLHTTPCQCFAATHDLELTVLLSPAFANYHFREQVQDGEVVFDYCLQTGPATTRNAILLLETMGFPQEVTGKARGTVAGFEKTGQWAFQG